MIKGLAQDCIARKDEARICTQFVSFQPAFQYFPSPLTLLPKRGQLMTGWLSLGHKESRHSVAVLWFMAQL